MNRSFDERIASFLLAVTAICMIGVLICAWGWYRASTTELEIDQLSSEDRQRLVEDLISISPGTHENSWYEPKISYTLKRNQEVSAWNDVFTTNSFGYRTGAVEKQPHTKRVLFVGDSWTFGLGVTEEQSFPKVFEKIANRTSGQRIEAWTLALPGYNTVAEVSALWFFFDRLKPDVVVISPSANDNDSMGSALPNGSPSRGQVRRDSFGAHHVVTFRTWFVNSHLYLSRWEQCFAELLTTEQRLRELDIPLMYFFIARWKAPIVHGFVESSGLEAPYLTAPTKFTLGEWRNPPPLGHATPAGNRLFGRMVYQGLAQLLEWPTLKGTPDVADFELFWRPPPGRNWSEEQRFLIDRNTRKKVPEDFHLSAAAKDQIAGSLDPNTGLMRRGTTILVRKAEGAERLRITVQRLPDVPSLYPLQLEVAVPSPAGGTRVIAIVPREGSPVHRFELPIPGDVSPGTALDVVFRAQRTAVAPNILAPRSIFITAIEQISSTQ